MAGYAETCQAILKEYGPLLGSELAERLAERAGVSATNARQILFRLKRDNEIRSTSPVSFGRNQFIYFLPRQNLLRRLAEVIPDQRQALHRVYLALLDQDGFLLWSDFAKISGGVVNPAEIHGRKTAQESYDDLKALGLVEPIRIFNQTRFVVASDSWVPSVNFSESTAIRRLEDARLTRRLTLDLLKWLERLNLAGWNKTFLYNEEDDTQGFNGFWWDATGVSYLWGLYTAKSKEDTFAPSPEKTGSLIFVESVLTRPFQMYDLNGFIARLGTQYRRIKQPTNFRIIPICFVYSIDPETLNQARRRGIMVVRLAEVFGTRIYDILSTVRKMDPRTFDPQALAEALRTFDDAGQEGKIANMKGYLFNWLIASVFMDYGWQTSIGVKYAYDGKNCECDVVGYFGDTLLLCECKGYDSDVTVELGTDQCEENTVRRFFDRTVPIIKAKTNATSVFPVFITSGTFSPAARKYLELRTNGKGTRHLLNKLDRFPHSLAYDFQELIAFFRDKGQFSVHKQVLNEFFRAKRKHSAADSSQGLTDTE